MAWWELQERSCYRGRPVGPPRRLEEGEGKLDLNPCPDKDRRRRRIRRREYEVDGRTDGTSGRDEKDVGVRS